MFRHSHIIYSRLAWAIGIGITLACWIYLAWWISDAVAEFVRWMG